MIAQAKALREQRHELAMKMTTMVGEAAKRENPGLTPEENAEFDRMEGRCKELEDLVAKIERANEFDTRSQEREEEKRKQDFNQNPKTADENVLTFRQQDQAFRTWALGRSAEKRMGSDYQKGVELAQRAGFRLNKEEWEINLLSRAPKSMAETRGEAWGELVTRATTTAQTITTTAGGHTIQNEMMREIEVALLEFGGVRQSGAQVIRTQTGATLPWPTVNDTTNKSVILAINTAADVEALVFGQKTFSAYKYSTSLVLVPMELMQDTSIDLVGLIGRALGERAGRGTNAHFTVGVTSDTQPNGIVTESIVGVTGSDVNTVTYAQLVSLQHSVDPAYRSDPSCGWMMSDTTLSVIKKLTDGQSRPLWLPALSGLAGGFPDTILGNRITINQDMASIASATTGTGGAKAILYGAFNRFKVRDVRDMTVLRLDERYAEKAQVAFIGFHRHDSGAVIASTATPPFKHYITKST